MKNLAHIEFYFPEKRGVKNKRELAGLILDMMRKSGSIAYAGHRDEKSLRENIMRHLGDADAARYKPLSESQKKKVLRQIEATIRKCSAILPIPTKNYVFVFPYLPTKKDAAFEGVMGVAPYSCVFHVFLSLNMGSLKALAKTVAHELNHTIFYYRHYDHLNNYTLLDEMIIEGLAENFREQVVGGTPAPWAVVLTRKGAFNALESLDKLLSSKNDTVHRNVLFGNKKYKRWTGYSIGYWIVKELIRKKPNLSWGDIMKLSSMEILRIAQK